MLIKNGIKKCCDKNKNKILFYYKTNYQNEKLMNKNLRDRSNTGLEGYKEEHCS